MWVIKDPFFSLVQSKMEDKYLNTMPGTNYVIDLLRFDPKNGNEEEFFNSLTQKIPQNLSKRGYHIEIKYKKKIIYNNFEEKDKQVVENIGSEILNHANSMVLELNQISLVKSNFFIKEVL